MNQDNISEGLLWLRLLFTNSFLNQVGTALFIIASLFIFSKEDIKSIKRAEILSNFKIMRKLRIHAFVKKRD